MKPSFLDSDQDGGKAMEEQIKNAPTTGTALANQAPLPKDFVIVFTFNSVADELKCMEYATQVLDTYTKEAQLFHTEIEHVYVVAVNFKEEIRRGDMDKLYSLIGDNLPKLIGNGDILIQSYYRCDIYLNTDRTIKSERCVLNIHVNKDTPLDKDFVFTLTNQYSSQAKSFVLEASSKVIKLK